MKNLIFIFCFLLAYSCTTPQQEEMADDTYDIVVYGGTLCKETSPLNLGVLKLAFFDGETIPDSQSNTCKPAVISWE